MTPLELTDNSFGAVFGRGRGTGQAPLPNAPFHGETLIFNLKEIPDRPAVYGEGDDSNTQYLVLTLTCSAAKYDDLTAEFRIQLQPVDAAVSKALEDRLYKPVMQEDMPGLMGRQPSKVFGPVLDRLHTEYLPAVVSIADDGTVLIDRFIDRGW